MMSGEECRFAVRIWRSGDIQKWPIVLSCVRGASGCPRCHAASQGAAGRKRATSASTVTRIRGNRSRARGQSMNRRVFRSFERQETNKPAGTQFVTYEPARQTRDAHAGDRSVQGCIAIADVVSASDFENDALPLFVHKLPRNRPIAVGYDETFMLRKLVTERGVPCLAR
jgi:hypothetical protein